MYVKKNSYRPITLLSNKTSRYVPSYSYLNLYFIYLVANFQNNHIHINGANCLENFLFYILILIIPFV